MTSHEIDSFMLFIHPPLSILGYIFIFLFMLAVFRKRNTEIGIARFFGLTSWTFTLLGLVTGMFWAQVAWGSYWSWDPKETLTLTLFVTLSAALMSSFEQRRSLTKWLALLACILSVVTALTSFITAGLHSFL